MIIIPKPTGISFPVPPVSKVRFGIEYTGNLSNIGRLAKYRNFISRQEDPKRVSFITTDGTNFFEPLGILKKEIRSNDPQSDQFLKIFQSDNKNAKIQRVLFFRDDSTDLSSKAFNKIEKVVTKYQDSQNNFFMILIIAGISIAILSGKKSKR